MVRYLPGCLFALLLVGCEEASEPLEVAEPDACIAAWHLPSGAVRASVGGVGEFEATDGRFSRRDGLGISASDGGISITLTAAGDRAHGEFVRGVEEGEFPLRATLGSRSSETGYALIYRAEDTFVSEDSSAGWLHVSGMDDGDLVGCFAFEVIALDRDETLRWRRGLLHVPPL